MASYGFRHGRAATRPPPRSPVGYAETHQPDLRGGNALSETPRQIFDVTRLLEVAGRITDGFIFGRGYSLSLLGPGKQKCLTAIQLDVGLLVVFVYLYF